MQCFSLKNGLLRKDSIKNRDPFVSYNSYTQEDIYVAENSQQHDELVRQVINTLSEMKFPVDSCVSSGNFTFVKTAFVIKKKYFSTPKYHYLKISLLIEVPNESKQPLNIKHVICTTCARCEEWECGQLPNWATQEKYQVTSRVQQVIFEFKERLAKYSMIPD